MVASEVKSQVELLHQISNIVSSNLSLEKMLQELIGLAVEVTGCDACLVYLVDHAFGGDRSHPNEDGGRHHGLGGAA